MVNVTDAIVTGAGATSLFSYLTNRLYGRLTDKVYQKDAYIYPPAGIISIVIPAFNEEDSITTTLKSILSQNIVLKYQDYFECIVVDNESTDRTAEIARQYCQVISAPRGKLNARDAGIRYASGDIIVSCDADCYYPPNWLNLLIRHFHRRDVVAAHSVILIQGNILQRIGAIWAASIRSHTYMRYRLSGANSAFRKEAYLAIGGFDLTTNQLDRGEMGAEEEVALYLKLSKLGTITFELQAPGFTVLRTHGEAMKDQRIIDTHYQKEIVRGERF